MCNIAETRTDRADSAEPYDRALRARNDVKPCKTVKGVEYKTPGQSVYSPVGGVEALHSQRRRQGFQSAHPH